MAAAALAQQAPPDPAAVMGGIDRQVGPLAGAWLGSPDPRLQAWGAYAVLRDWLTDATPTLLQMLARYSPGEDAARHDAMLAVLDALIQMGANVPAADAQRIYAEFPVQSLILLSRAAEGNAPALMDIFENERREPAAWLAAGNLLLAQRAQGFAAAVLEGMTVHALVTVTEPNSGGGFGGSNLCTGLGGAAQPKAGWPAVGIYAFGGCGDSVKPGAMMLAAGADPAYYYRQVNSSYQMDATRGCCGVCRPDKDLVRQHYLTALLAASADDPPVRAHISQTIAWQSVDAYRQELQAFIAGQEHVFTELARRLGSQELLSDEEVKSLVPTLEIRIWDQRASRGPALPALATLPDRVTVEPF
jgi:hypothetical protein